jgi:hypothetical protein
VLDDSVFAGLVLLKSVCSILGCRQVESAGNICIDNCGLILQEAQYPAM